MSTHTHTPELYLITMFNFPNHDSCITILDLNDRNLLLLLIHWLSSAPNFHFKTLLFWSRCPNSYKSADSLMIEFTLFFFVVVLCHSSQNIFTINGWTMWKMSPWHRARIPGLKNQAQWTWSSRQCPLLASSIHGPQMVWDCVCVCVCVDGMNLKCALCWHIHIPVYSVLCQCIHTSTHTYKRPHTIWGQRTDRASHHTDGRPLRFAPAPEIAPESNSVQALQRL